ncbi:MAG TPA: M1 family metallopeptidase, partial [Herpetosiphonaceae bacterium]|nr:M1 family metallopeptidase [Herpetosiphonaceae bacterium]
QSLALKPESAAADLAGKPARYEMDIDADPEAGTFSGSQVIVYSNATGAVLPDLALRSYVNFPPDVMGDGGDTEMNVLSASADGQPLAIRREAQGTLFRLALPAPLQPGATISLLTTFAGTLKPWDDGSWPFVSSYPLLAEWDGGDWRREVTRFPDRVYAQAALYDVTVTLPSDLEVFASGSPITSSDDGATITTRFVSGPIREWAASFGRFEAVSGVTDGITVTAYQAQGAGLDLERIRAMAAGSLASYEERFGPYPYRELDLHAMDWGGDAGVEYPGYTLILINGQVNRRTDFVVAHEVAHQWWYAVVGNDIYRAAWLDESFATYSAMVAGSDVLGADAAAAYYEQEIEQAYRNGVNNGDYPAGLAIDEYPSFNAYYRAVYGKGAVFLATLRDELGDEAFFAGMRSYYAAERHGVGTRAEFQAAMEAAAGRPLGALFDEWLGR